MNRRSQRRDSNLTSGEQNSRQLVEGPDTLNLSPSSPLSPLASGSRKEHLDGRKATKDSHQNVGNSATADAAVGDAASLVTLLWQAWRSDSFVRQQRRENSKDNPADLPANRNYPGTVSALFPIYFLASRSFSLELGELGPYMSRILFSELKGKIGRGQ